MKGYMDYKKDSRIKGVIFNQMSEALYQRIKEQAEAELGIRCLGCVPVMKDMGLESRHLGLVMPDEIEGLRENLRKLADVLEKTLDLEGLLRLAGSAGSIEGQAPAGERKLFSEEEGPVIAVARDEAFCFLYEDNLELLRRMGAKIRFFSLFGMTGCPGRTVFCSMGGIRNCTPQNSAETAPCGRASAAPSGAGCPVWPSAAVLCICTGKWKIWRENPGLWRGLSPERHTEPKAEPVWLYQPEAG